MSFVDWKDHISGGSWFMFELQLSPPLIRRPGHVGICNLYPRDRAQVKSNVEVCAGA